MDFLTVVMSIGGIVLVSSMYMIYDVNKNVKCDPNKECKSRAACESLGCELTTKFRAQG